MIDNIRQQGRDIDWQNHDSIIKFYENNQLFFDNYDLINNQDEIVDIIQMKVHYINALNTKKRYTKALGIISHLENLLNKIDKDSELYEKYNTEKLFFYGMLKGNLKDYKESYSVFSDLTEIDPNNDLYKDWHIAIKMQLQYQYLKYGSIIGAVIVFGDILFDLAFDYEFNNRLVLFGWILMLGSWLGPKVYQYLRKNMFIK